MLFENNAQMTKVDGKILKIEREALWKLVFYHDLNKATYFSNKEDAKECNEEGRYSTLKSISSIYKIKGKYEFLLEYPEINKSNQWRQSLNPFHQSSDGTNNATGYEDINVQMNDKYWGGLFRKNGDACLLVGSRNGFWHFAIGVHSEEYKPYFPGPSTNSKIVKLWIRMPTSLYKNSCKVNRRMNNFSILFYIFILRRFS